MCCAKLARRIDYNLPMSEAPDSQPIRCFFKGELRSLQASSPTQTVLQWLREDERACGTKEGCAEGDCGACMVAVAELRSGQLQLSAVNACIQFLPSLHGKALLTVEDLQQGGKLHPVQQAMVDCHGSQCGFCTPGFVMSLWVAEQNRRLANDNRLPTRPEIEQTLSGNLCRCTGYIPIIQAAQQAAQADYPAHDFTAIKAALAAVSSADFVHQTKQGSYHAPSSVSRLAALKMAHPEANLVAGCTDVGLWVTKHLRHLPTLISTKQVSELQAIERDGETLRIGAAVSLTDAYTALLAHYPEAQELYERFASPPIRQAGTLGGNIANGSPIGDSMPLLLALDARVVLQREQVQRALPLHEFYLAYQKNALQSGEFLRAVVVPIQTGLRLASYKLSKRRDQDISAVACGFALRLTGNTVSHVRLAYGGMAAIPKRALQAEAALLGKPFDEEQVSKAAATLADDFTPLSDMRASSSYRLQMAQALLQRFYLSKRLVNPLPDAQLRLP
jgi:xanthine dehydrogenase small subunit